MKLSIIICTYDRDKVLAHCLDSLVEFSHDVAIHEVILVDNLPSDSTRELVGDYTRKINSLKYIAETNTGLSYARNAGVKNATGDWLFFLDDDGKIQKNTLTEIGRTIRDFEFAFFTGIWKAWHIGQPPKWFPYDAGNYRVKGELGVRDIGDDYISGGVMVISKKVFMKEIGSFPSELGMSGDKIGFGEESYVEKILKEKGYSIGINTEIVIDHLVNTEKYKVTWHLEVAYQKGFANAFLKGDQTSNGIYLKYILSVLTGWIKPLLKLVVRKQYYYQNFVIEYKGAIRYLKGQIARSQE